MAVVADAGFFPISDISSYQAKWCIRARVTAKGNVRNFTSRNGAAVTVFECTLLDESGEIKASFFGQMAEKFSSVIEQGKVFKFSRGSCRVANRQYNRTGPSQRCGARGRRGGQSSNALARGWAAVSGR